MSRGWQLGSQYLGDSQTAFQVWAPHAGKWMFIWCSPEERIEPLKRTEDGYHQGVVRGQILGTLLLSAGGRA